MRSLIIAVGVAVSSFVAVGASWAENVTLRFSNWLPPTHYIVTEMIQPWMDSVEEATQGRVSFETSPALGAPAAHLDLVSTGVADIAFVPHGYTPARFKLTELGELPFTSDDAVTNSIAYWKTYNKFMLGANEHRGVKLLSFWTTTPSQIFVSDPLTTLDQLAGKKIRVTSPTLEKIADTLNLTSVSASASEAYELMSRGTIDGTFFQSDSIVAFRLDEFTKGQINVPGGFIHSSQMLIMNPAKWEEISDADQKAIEELSGESMARKFASVWDAKAQEGDDVLAEAGVVVTEVSGSELEKLIDSLQYLRTDWVEEANKRGIDGQAALEYFEKLLDENAVE
ncbi:TRAP transporter substrate-binding protein [Sulfitobacter sp. 1A13421]|uniref:TRAP transporter substrate-binding protein n=1 Tax=Sulfitobacter sp. 1A13421 TaxID=3368595 RepID=UPI003746673E